MGLNLGWAKVSLRRNGKAVFKGAESPGGYAATPFVAPAGPVGLNLGWAKVSLRRNGKAVFKGARPEGPGAGGKPL